MSDMRRFIEHIAALPYEPPAHVEDVCGCPIHQAQRFLAVAICNSEFDDPLDDPLVDRTVFFVCDLLKGHDGAHAERGYGWSMVWGEGVGMTENYSAASHGIPRTP